MNLSALRRSFKKSLRYSRRIAAQATAAKDPGAVVSTRHYRTEPPLGFQSRSSHSFFVR